MILAMFSDETEQKTAQELAKAMYKKLETKVLEGHW